MKPQHVYLLVCIVSAVIAVWQHGVGQQDLSNIFCIVTMLYGFGAWKEWRRA